MTLLDRETVLVVASSMGQKPFQSKMKGGKQIAQWRALDALRDLLGVRSTAKAISTMSDEFVIYAQPDAERDRILGMLEASYIDTPEQKTFICSSIDGAVRVNLRAYQVGTIKPTSKVHFPTAPGEPVRQYDDVIYNTGHLKSGCHDERGMIVFFGAGIPRGLELSQYDNLDIAPTLMSLLGLPIPPEMRSEPMREIVADGGLRRPHLVA